MKIQDKDLMHGAALTQIVEHPTFKALNRGGRDFGHYRVNDRQHLLIRYSTSKGTTWTFNISVKDMKLFRSLQGMNEEPFLVLVCRNITVCCLSKAEVAQVLDITSKTHQWVKVTVPSRASCRVSGSAGKLPGTIAHRSFPGKVFA